MFDFLNIKMDFFKKKADIEAAGEAGDVNYQTMGLSQPTFGPPPRDIPPEMALPSASQSYPPLSSVQPAGRPIGGQEFASQENMKAKIDLIMTHIENLKLQHDTINQRLEHVEGMIKQLLDIAKGRY